MTPEPTSSALAKPAKGKLFLPLFALLVLSCDQGSPKPVPMPEKKATLTAFRGDVKVKRSDGHEWIDAQVKLELARDDKVRTLKDSEATIVFDEGSTVVLDSESLISISELPAERAKAGVTLLRGKLDAEVDRSRTQDFTVRTPSAEARAGREIVFQ